MRAKSNPLYNDLDLVLKIYELSAQLPVGKRCSKYEYVHTARTIAELVSTEDRQVLPDAVVRLWNAYGQCRHGFIQEIRRRLKAKESLALLSHFERVKLQKQRARMKLKKVDAKPSPLPKFELSEEQWILVADSLMRKAGNMRFAVEERELYKLDIFEQTLMKLIRKKYRDLPTMMRTLGDAVHAKRKALGGVTRILGTV